MKFQAAKETANIIQFIRKYYQKYQLGGAILGISGGKDSAVVAALMVEALGADHVIGVTLPCHSNDEDKIDAKLIADHYHFPLVNVDLTGTYDSFSTEITKLGDFSTDDKRNSDINVKPRLRMMTLYYLAALYSAVEKKGYLVVGTSNKCELYVGYFTKGGDSVHDIAPIADLTVEEVIQIGEYLHVPAKVLYKTPNDGLSNQTDEQKLGVSYRDIARYMEDPKSVDLVTRGKIERLHQLAAHKFAIPTYYKTDKGAE